MGGQQQRAIAAAAARNRSQVAKNLWFLVVRRFPSPSLSQTRCHKLKGYDHITHYTDAVYNTDLSTNSLSLSLFLHSPLLTTSFSLSLSIADFLPCTRFSNYKIGGILILTSEKVKH